MTDILAQFEPGQRYRVIDKSEVVTIGPSIGDCGTLLAADMTARGRVRLLIRWDNFRTGIELIEDVVNQIDLSCMEGLL